MEIGLGIVFFVFLYYSYKYAWWGSKVSFYKPRILMYHMVSNHKKDAKFNGLRVKPDEFEKQIAYLALNNWNFFTMSELVEKKDNLPFKSVAITFDDGYEDNLLNALPILEKYNAKATIYLVVNRHNNDWSTKRKKKNNTGELKKEPKLKDEQVQSLIKSNIIEIGSHTMTHDNLPTLNKKQKECEIINSKKYIEDKFGITCKSFCYPFGLYDSTDINIVKQSEYLSATTTQKGIENLKESNLLSLKRVPISGKDNMLAFKLKIKRGLKGVKK